MKTRCYSVRLASLVSISDQAFKATAFDGSKAVIPKSQVFGRDFNVTKSEAFWITAWILERKNMQYSSKKAAWFDEKGQMLPERTIEKYVPIKKHITDVEPIKTLTR